MLVRSHYYADSQINFRSVSGFICKQQSFHDSQTVELSGNSSEILMSNNTNNLEIIMLNSTINLQNE